MPPKNDFSMLPVNAEARRLAGMWAPAQDAGNECRSYGAASIILPNVLAKLGADVLGVNPFASTAAAAASAESDTHTARTSELVRASGSEVGFVIDPDGYRLEAYCGAQQ